ncbi:MAG: hypothetical protein PHC39_10985 [Proteiniphilum sp.]|nr:hypothetical protein [Proteiniphilum sp.]
MQIRTAPYDYGGATGYAGDVCAEPPYDDMTVSEAEQVFGTTPTKGSKIKRRN